ncbi:hypothetical protein F1188_18940 [Roseospira marina]|uniref:Uncharacterized protein n=2 Tax=Roseospira marina TaxID=140057 RepID=A0A5M6I6X4_9PROT|nr:hypothetical protein [Roseospira marina]KAA5603852.1 hypothetical protein F1188_18940 [Roseospira marina]MBB4313758.1 hypothetical protein [Roseospira marina]MBB5086920.1 hypothetical protein [Roseospira marina]
MVRYLAGAATGGRARRDPASRHPYAKAAGLLTATPPDRTRLVAALDAAAGTSGMAVQHLDEGAFARALADT